MLLKYEREKEYCFPGQQNSLQTGSSERSVRTYQKESRRGLLEAPSGCWENQLNTLTLTVQRKGKVGR